MRRILPSRLAGSRPSRQPFGEAAAVADPDVQVAVGTECQLAAVVEGIGVGDRQDLAAGVRIHDEPVEVHVVFEQDHPAATIRQIQEEPPVLTERRVKDDPQQPLLERALTRPRR